MLKPHLVNGGRVERAGDTYRLILPPTPASEYADAQLDDYEHVLPRSFRNAPPQRLRVRARFSGNTLKGTAGFGFWNHPFARDGGVIAPPCNVWFFHASPESDMQLVRGIPGHGFKAAMLRTPAFLFGRAGTSSKASTLMSRATAAASRAAMRLPFASRAMMSAARAVVSAREVLLPIDMSAWHDYAIDWQPDVAVFRVDGAEVLRALKPPRLSMGFVAWVDNYRATAGGGTYGFAFVATPGEQWLELEVRGLA